MCMKLLCGSAVQTPPSRTLCVRALCVCARHKWFRLAKGIPAFGRMWFCYSHIKTIRWYDIGLFGCAGYILHLIRCSFYFFPCRKMISTRRASERAQKGTKRAQSDGRNKLCLHNVSPRTFCNIFYFSYLLQPPQNENRSTLSKALGRRCGTLRAFPAAERAAFVLFIFQKM